MRPLRPKYILLLVALTCIYIVSAKIGLALAVINPSATAIWAPTGIAIAANLIFGYRVWPAFLVGAFISNILTAGSVESSVAIAVGNTLEGFTGAWLVNRFAHGRFAFDTPSDAFKFAFAAAGIAPIVSATIGVTSLSVFGYSNWAAYIPTWTTWWLGDATGAIIAAPVIVLWSNPTRRWEKRELIEAGVLYLLVIVSADLVFNSAGSLAARHYPVGFVIIPVLVWAAFRLGPRDTATAIALIAVLAVWGTLRGLGVFSVSDRNTSLLLLQSYMAVLAITFVALAAAVRQRDRLLLAEQQSRSLAESAVRAREEFLSIASHELRTPVASLKGSVQLLRRRRTRGEVDFERFDRMLEIIEATADRLTALVNQLLDVSRIQTRHLDLSAEPLDLAAALRESVERARMHLGDRHTFTLALDGTQSSIWGDPGRLDQVWSNVLENAVKYSPHGGEVQVSLRSTDDNGFEVGVQDSGIGLPAGSQDTVFQPFSRAANATAGHFAGMGLGLYICRNIIERHGGRMWAESPGEGRGTAVHIWLPRYEPQSSMQPAVLARD